MPKVDRRLTNDCVYSWVTVTHRDEVQAGDLPSLFSARAGQRSVNTQFMRWITIGCTGAAVVSFFAMDNLSPPPGDPYRYPTEMNAKPARYILLTLLLIMHGCAHADEPPIVNDAWGPVAHRVDEQGFRWTERKSPTLGLIARTATRHKTWNDPNSELEIIVNVISTDEEFPRHIYNDWVYPNGTRQREFHLLPPYKCYSIVSAKHVENFSIEDRKTRKLLAVFVFDAEQRLILDPIQNDLLAYDSARLYEGFSPNQESKPDG